MRIFTDEQKLVCIKRELQQRERVYAHLVEEGRMTRERARYEIECMKAILDDYKALASKEQLAL